MDLNKVGSNMNIPFDELGLSFLKDSQLFYQKESKEINIYTFELNNIFFDLEYNKVDIKYRIKFSRSTNSGITIQTEFYSIPNKYIENIYIKYLTLINCLVDNNFLEDIN